MKLNVWRKQQDNINPKTIIIIAIFAIIVIAVFLSDLTTILSPCVGLIEINGEISMERIPNSLLAEGMPNAEDIAGTIKNIEKTKPNVKALVVVINSPGGSVVGSRIIRESIKSSKMPVVAYLSEVAASGGYYIATGSDYIIADPNTLTGSIGVIAIFADARALLEKIGVNITAVTTGKYKSMGSFFSGLSEDEKVLVEQLLNESYNEFLDVILEGRKGKITREKLLSIADGRVLSGRQAKSYGLVDALGMKDDAIKKAKELANLSDAGLCNIRVRSSQTTGLFAESNLISSFIDIFQGLKFK